MSSTLLTLKESITDLKAWLDSNHENLNGADSSVTDPTQLRQLALKYKVNFFMHIFPGVTKCLQEFQGILEIIICYKPNYEALPSLLQSVFSVKTCPFF